MATPRLFRSPTCLGCLRRLAQPAAPSPLSWTQTRTKTAKAEDEDLQGIPVRLLRDIPAFGRKHAIIRVKAGRMRNLWFPRGAAEYMTRQRFAELGLTEAAIGMRDRTFGSRLALEAEEEAKKPTKSKRKENLILAPEDTQEILAVRLPQILVFPRIPVTTTPPPPPQPATPRSPSLAAGAVTSVSTPAAPVSSVKPIFGSVSPSDILHAIKTVLLEDPRGSRAVLEIDALQLVGLHPEHDGGDRIKTLGQFEIIINLGTASDGRPLEPLRRAVHVVAESAEHRAGEAARKEAPKTQNDTPR
ncbi:hypothetical protein GGR50DRAFT_694567 [Xylaria sp. CBS 124048]|nr:hypothetical protein GGR50DRAFT_694567 [Xylaria sp. CBS 124048]